MTREQLVNQIMSLGAASDEIANQIADEALAGKIRIVVEGTPLEHMRDEAEYQVVRWFNRRIDTLGRSLEKAA